MNTKSICLFVSLLFGFNVAGTVFLPLHPRRCNDDTGCGFTNNCGDLRSGPLNKSPSEFEWRQVKCVRCRRDISFHRERSQYRVGSSDIGATRPGTRRIGEYKVVPSVGGEPDLKSSLKKPDRAPLGHNISHLEYWLVQVSQAVKHIRVAENQIEGIPHTRPNKCRRNINYSYMIGYLS